MNPQRQAFMEAIKQDPSCAATRYAFADWLDEHDEPEHSDFHRSWTPRKYELANKWMKGIASKAGQTCLNYGEGLTECFDATKDMGYDDPRREELRDQIPKEKWRDITYDDLIQAGYNFLKEEDWDWFVQSGQEWLRDNIVGKKLEKYWEYWQIITGVFITPVMKTHWELGKYHEWASPFSCLC